MESKSSLVEYDKNELVSEKYSICQDIVLRTTKNYRNKYVLNMINTLAKIKLILLLSVLPIVADAQISILDYFTASETNEQVLLKWSISTGETCNGINITRSTDTIGFQIIGEIAGVCGDADVHVPYSFLDESPLKNQVTYYRLELGISDFSEVIAIEVIEKNETGFQIRPHPMKNTGRIYFDNPQNDEWEFSLYQLSGQLLESRTTQGQFIEVNTAKYSSGLYVFSFKSMENDELINGKLMIQK